MKTSSSLVLLVLLALAHGYLSPGPASESDSLDDSAEGPCYPDQDCTDAGGQCIASHRRTDSCIIINADLCSGTSSSDSNNCVCCIISSCPTGTSCGTNGVCRDTCLADEVIVGTCGLTDTGCNCCEPCVADETCSASDGVCVEGSCPDGTTPSSVGGCGSTSCTCCVPCVLSSACAGSVTNPGECLINPDTCNGDNQYTTSDDCGECTCCKTCIEDSACDSENGICYSQVSGGCPAGRVATTGAGQCNGGSCTCCITECNATETCDGRCVAADVFCDGTLEYISTSDTDVCGEGCYCCKTCTADAACENENGQCAELDTCPEGFEVTPGEGTCGSDSCSCCTRVCNATETCDGRCVAAEVFCDGEREYTTEGVCDTGCVCCETCTPDDQCVAEGGQCDLLNACSAGREVTPGTGTCSGDICSCCTTVCSPTGTCSGRCAGGPGLCDVNSNEFPSYQEACGTDCTCCKICTPKNQCTSVGGICYPSTCPNGTTLEGDGNQFCVEDGCVCCF